MNSSKHVLFSALFQEMQKIGRCLTIFTFFSLRKSYYFEQNKTRTDAGYYDVKSTASPRSKQQLYYVPSEEHGWLLINKKNIVC